MLPKTSNVTDLISKMISARIKALHNFSDIATTTNAKNHYDAKAEELGSLLMMIGEAERRGNMVLNTNYCVGITPSNIRELVNLQLI